MISPIFIILTIISATMVITSINPVHSIIWLVLSFIGSAIVFMQLQANFIALATLIIYVGAIAVLFIFVLMMLNLSTKEADPDTTAVLPITLTSISTIILLIINIALPNKILNNTNNIVLDYSSNLQMIGQNLYTSYANYFILASVVLLVAMIGGIVLTLNPSLNVKRQNSFLQTSRDIYRTQ